MARSIRLLYLGVKGRERVNYNWAPIHQSSAVVITAAEWAGDAGMRDLVPPQGRPHLGEANVYVTNIGPHDPEGEAGGVEFFIHVDADHSLDVMVTLTVLEDVESFTVA